MTMCRQRVRRVMSVGTVVGCPCSVIGGLAVLPARTWLGQESEREMVEAELTEVERRSRTTRAPARSCSRPTPRSSAGP